ncbi:hypothetical protein GGR54DRAFT_237652 [Hypoxylon sp. NC1633]|nr:hypothetical protein GGR54DRAFT_237652 [Hypoxylon sp. NC1633]
MACLLLTLQLIRSVWHRNTVKAKCSIDSILTATWQGRIRQSQTLELQNTSPDSAAHTSMYYPWCKRRENHATSFQRTTDRTSDRTIERLEPCQLVSSISLIGRVAIPALLNYHVHGVSSTSLDSCRDGWTLPRPLKPVR